MGSLQEMGAKRQQPMDPRPLAVLDMNAIIALKENEREVGSLRDVIDAWRQVARPDRIRLAVSAIVGGERSRQEIGDEGGLIAMRPRLVAIGIGDTRACGGCLRYILGPFGPDTDLRRWGERYAGTGARNAKKRAVVAVARRLAVLLLALWKTGEVYEPLRNAMAREAA